MQLITLVINPPRKKYKLLVYEPSNSSEWLVIPSYFNKIIHKNKKDWDKNIKLECNLCLQRVDIFSI